MNVFELALVVAPVAGCIAAMKSAAGHSPAFVAACAVAGLVIGAVSYFGPVFAATWLWSRVRNPDAPPDRPGAIEWLTGTAAVTFAAVSPIVAWFVATYGVSRFL
jgi:hypothetical protein